MNDPKQPKINGVKYIVNPITNKPIKVGGKTFSSLVRQGVFNQNPSLASVPENKRVRPAKAVVARATDKTQAYRLKNKLELEKPLPKNQLYSVGNDGKTIVVKNKKAPTLKPENLVTMMSKASVEVNKRLMADPNWSQILKQNPDNIDQNVKDQIEHMILQELISNGKTIDNKKIINYNIKENNAKPKTKRFTLQQTQTVLQQPTYSSSVRSTQPPRRRRQQPIFSDTDAVTEYETNAYDDETGEGDSDEETELE